MSMLREPATATNQLVLVQMYAPRRTEKMKNEKAVLSTIRPGISFRTITPPMPTEFFVSSPRLKSKYSLNIFTADWIRIEAKSIVMNKRQSIFPFSKEIAVPINTGIMDAVKV